MCHKKRAIRPRSALTIKVSINYDKIKNERSTAGFRITAHMEPDNQSFAYRGIWIMVLNMVNCFLTA